MGSSEGAKPEQVQLGHITYQVDQKLDSGIVTAGFRNPTQVLRVDNLPLQSLRVNKPGEESGTSKPRVVLRAALGLDQPTLQPTQPPEVALEILRPDAEQRKAILTEQIFTPALQREKMRDALAANKSDREQALEAQKHQEELRQAKVDPLAYLAQKLKEAAGKKEYSPQLLFLAQAMEQRAHFIELSARLRQKLTEYSQDHLRVSGMTALDGMAMFFNLPENKNNAAVVPRHLHEKVVSSLQLELADIEPEDELADLYLDCLGYLRFLQNNLSLKHLPAELLAMMAEVVGETQSDLAMVIASQELVVSAFVDCVGQWWDENWQILHPRKERQLTYREMQQPKPLLTSPESLLGAVHQKLMKFGFMSEIVEEKWLDLLEQVNVTDLGFMAETALKLWQENKTHHPIFFRYMQQLAAKMPTAEVVVQHTRLQERVLDLLKKSPQYLLDQLDALLQLTDKLVPIPLGGADQKLVGYDLEYLPKGLVTSPPPQTKMDEASGRFMEIKRSDKSLSLDANYRAELGELAVWMANYGEPRSIHLHFDQAQQISAMGINLQGLLASEEKKHSYTRATFENRAVFVPMTNGKIDARILTAMMDLFANANEKPTKIWRPLRWSKPEAMDEKHAMWGQILRTTEHGPSRLAGLISLQHPQALMGDVKEPSAFLQTFDAAAILKMRIEFQGEGNDQREYKMDQLQTAVTLLWQEFIKQHPEKTADHTEWLRWLGKYIHKDYDDPLHSSPSLESLRYGPFGKIIHSVRNIRNQALLAALPIEDEFVPKVIGAITAKSFQSLSDETRWLVGDWCKSPELFFTKVYEKIKAISVGTIEEDIAVAIIANAPNLPQVIWDKLLFDLKAKTSAAREKALYLLGQQKLPPAVIHSLLAECETNDFEKSNYGAECVNLLHYKIENPEILHELARKLAAEPQKKWLQSILFHQHLLPSGILEILKPFFDVQLSKTISLPERLDILNEYKLNIALNKTERKRLRQVIIQLFNQTTSWQVFEELWDLLGHHKLLATQLNIQDVVYERIQIGDADEHDLIVEALFNNHSLLSDAQKLRLLQSSDSRKQECGATALGRQLHAKELPHSNRKIRMREKVIKWILKNGSMPLKTEIARMIDEDSGGEHLGQILIRPLQLLQIESQLSGEVASYVRSGIVQTLYTMFFWDADDFDQFASNSILPVPELTPAEIQQLFEMVEKVNFSEKDYLVTLLSRQKLTSAQEVLLEELRMVI